MTIIHQYTNEFVSSFHWKAGSLVFIRSAIAVSCAQMLAQLLKTHSTHIFFPWRALHKFCDQHFFLLTSVVDSISCTARYSLKCSVQIHILRTYTRINAITMRFITNDDDGDAKISRIKYIINEILLAKSHLSAVFIFRFSRRILTCVTAIVKW